MIHFLLVDFLVLKKIFFAEFTSTTSFVLEIISCFIIISSSSNEVVYPKQIVGLKSGVILFVLLCYVITKPVLVN